MKITVDMIMSLDAFCDYPIERVEELLGDREYLSLTEICDLDIPIQDKIWACSRFLSEQSCRLFACDCAESVLHIWSAKYPDDNRLAETIRISRLYANFEVTKEQLDAANAAAMNAARAAARHESAAASAAAWTAARAADRTAARYAARAADWAASSAASSVASSAADWAASDADWAAARAAARAAAWDAERSKQMEFLQKYCELED